MGFDLGGVGVEGVAVGVEGVAVGFDLGGVGVDRCTVVAEDGALGLELSDARLFEGLEAGDVFVLKAQLFFVLVETLGLLL